MKYADVDYNLSPQFYKKWIKLVVSELKKFVKANYKEEFVGAKPSSSFLPFNVKQSREMKSIYVYGKPSNISFVKDNQTDVPNSSFVELPKEKWRKVKLKSGFRTIKRSNESRYSFTNKPLNDNIVRFWSVLRNNKDFVFGETQDGFVEYIISDKSVSSWLMEENQSEIDAIIMECFDKVVNELNPEIISFEQV